ncbi:hypothetical protein EDB85DRAFT_2204749 [Lactarius pseudohatsudake]|nr:hypothetical protein EDB85DRAFT_2204749 [Lactarius pseudohatsudake]
MTVSKPKIFSIKASHSGRFHDLTGNTSPPAYTFYVRKHNPTISYDLVTLVPSRLWLFATLNMVDNGHDTTIDFAGDNRTLILLTFDETETYTVNLTTASSPYYLEVLSPRVPEGPSTQLTTLTTPHSPPWRQTEVSGRSAAATRTRGSNVYSFVTNATDYTNFDIALPDYVPITAPNTSAVGAGGGAVFVASGVDTNLTAASAPTPVNLTAQGKTVQWLGPHVAAAASNSSSGSGNGATGIREGVVAATVLDALLASVVTIILASGLRVMRERCWFAGLASTC